MIEEINDIIEIRFEGNGISPDAVKPSEIAQLVESFEKALLLTIKEDHPEIDTDTVLFSFHELKDASLGIRFKPRIVRDIVLGSFFTITTAVNTGNYNDLNDNAVNHLKTFTKFSKKYGCVGHFNKNNETLSSISPTTEIIKQKAPTVKGQTTIYGELIDAGGEKPNVHLKIDEDYILIFDTSKTNVKTLSKKLYEKVGLVGEAKWESDTLKIIDFKLTEILDYSPGNTLAAIKELKKLSSGYWDNYNSNDDINKQLLRD